MNDFKPVDGEFKLLRPCKYSLLTHNWVQRLTTALLLLSGVSGSKLPPRQYGQVKAEPLHLMQT